MKSSWDNGLRTVALLGMLFGATSLSAQAIPAQVAEPNPTAAPKVVAIGVVREDGSVLVAQPAGLLVEVGKPLLPEQVAAPNPTAAPKVVAIGVVREDGS